MYPQALHHPLVSSRLPGGSSRGRQPMRLWQQHMKPIAMPWKLAAASSSAASDSDPLLPTAGGNASSGLLLGDDDQVSDDLLGMVARD